MDEKKLIDEYNKLAQGLNMDSDDVDELASPVLPEDILAEAVPGSIRKAEHFVAMMDQVVTFLKKKMDVANVQVETPLSFVHSLEQLSHVDSKPLKAAQTRLGSLLKTLEIINLHQYTPLALVADFLTLVATYKVSIIGIDEHLCFALFYLL